MIKEFVKNPAENYGFLVHNTSGHMDIEFYCSEYSNQELRPKLTISYTEPTTSILSVPQDKSLSGFVVRPQRHALHLDGSNLLSPFEVAVSRPDGKRLFHDRFAAGAQRQLTNLGTGVYIISVKELNRQGSRIVTLIP